MRLEKEIEKKIKILMEIADDYRGKYYDSDKYNATCRQIEALSWALGNNDKLMDEKKED